MLSAKERRAEWTFDLHNVSNPEVRRDPAADRPPGTRGRGIRRGRRRDVWLTNSPERFPGRDGQEEAEADPGFEEG